VARLESPELSAHLTAGDGVTVASPIAIASSAFGEAALATIPLPSGERAAVRAETPASGDEARAE